MKFHRKLIYILPLALSLFFHAEALGQSRWQGTCDITFTGTSTLHRWSGKVAAEPFGVLITDAGDLSKMTVATEARVMASKMDTENEKRDAKMHESMDITSYPEIKVFVNLPEGLKASTKPVVENGKLRPTEIPFTMNLKGKVQNLIGKVTSWKYDGSVATFSVAFPLSLKASGIKVPSVLGVVRVGDRIDVKADVKLVAPGVSVSPR